MSKFVDDLPSAIPRDWLGTMLGQKIGGGIGRAVFVLEFDARYVVKIETAGYQNAVEWQIWQALKESAWAKYFAPCKHISAYGSVLIQERTLPAPRKKYPKRMPIFFGDYKYSNWGLLRGKLVCHDYGSMLNFSNGILSTATRKADWWDPEDGSTFDDSRKS